MSLFDFFKCFTKISAFGLEIGYFIDSKQIVIFYGIDEIVNTTYSPTLSSMEIIIKDKETINLIINKLVLMNKCSPELKLLLSLKNEDEKLKANPFQNEVLISKNNANFKLIVKSGKCICIEYYETKPPHSRQILIKQIEQLLNEYDALKNIQINNIDYSSWFSVLWTPYKSSKGNLINCSFLSYYQFNSKNFSIEECNSNNFTEIPIIGILPIKFENKLFLTGINKNLQLNGMGVGFNQINPNMGIYQQNGIFNENNHNNLLLKSSIV
jgi:hypothetical protein